MKVDRKKETTELSLSLLINTGRRADMRMYSWCLSFLGIVIICTVRTDALTFVVEPGNQDVTEGEQAVLPCLVDEKGVTYEWTLDNNNVDTIAGVTIDDGSLIIDSVDKDVHDGEFRCVVSSPNQNQPLVSQPAQLLISWISTPRIILKIPDDLSLISEGSQVRMTCKADGSSDPVFTFYRDSTPLTNNENTEINGKTLKLLSVSTNDNGVYSCKAENRAGEAASRNNLTISILGSLYPTIVVQPQDQMVVEGGVAIFHCQFSGTPPPPVEWYTSSIESGGMLFNQSGTTLFPNGTLILHDVQLLDESQYNCLCKSRYGEPTASAELLVARVEPLPEMEAIVVAEESPQTFSCGYPSGNGGIPRPTLQWTKVGGTLSTDESERVHVKNGSVLFFSPIRESDEGIYTCTSSNLAGEVTSDLEITVATKPVFTVLPSDVVVKETATSQLDCQADSKPAPTIKWYHKNVEMTQSQFIKILDNGTLVFFSSSLQNAGTYSCVASNIVTRSEASAELTVEAILKFNPKPVLSTQFELKLEEKINCRASAATKVSFTWMKDNEENTEWDDHVSIGYEWDAQTSIANGMLMFNGAKMSDTGAYTCTARTDDDVINATIKVEVFVKPKFTIIPENTTVVEGESLNLNCDAYGDPKPVITWVKQEGKESKSIKTTNNSLYIENVGEKDAGKYTCFAGSKGGLNTTDVFITVTRGAAIPPMSPEVMTRTFAIAVGCALAYILLFIFLMVWCKQRRRKRRMTLKEDGSKEEGPLANGLGEYHDEEVNKGDLAMTAAAFQASRINYDKLQFPRHDLETIAVIGHGAYGEVSIARAQGIRDGEDATTVLVKALETKDDNLQLNFRGEIDMLNKLNHENIVKLLGICKDGEPQLMITEYLDWGDLKQFLKATKGEDKGTNTPPPLTYNQKIDIISQVALGMEHLSNNRFVHADLAARNCLLSPSMEVKICTMSASKDLYRDEYHEYQQRLMPVRWMPVEAIFEDELSTKSDVWSFGIFIWEVFSQGELPYSEVDNDGYMSAIVDGDLVLKTPGETPEEVENMMQRCWASSLKDRPSFSELVIAMQQLNSDSNM